MTDWVVDALRPQDRAAWERLYLGYSGFYEHVVDAEHLDRVWGWLHDPAHELSGLVVRPAPGDEPVGLAHVRPFSRPLDGTVGTYLDDLFVDPDVRGGGAASALLEHLRQVAIAQGHSVVRWMTRATNTRARAVYDRFATATPYVTYDMAATGEPTS